MANQFNNAEIATTDETSLTNTRQAIIGGSNTTVSSDDTVVVGTSTATVNLNPSSGKLFLKDNPVYIKSRVIKNAVGIITANDISNGVVEIQTSGAYTFDSTTNIRNRVYDSTGAAFVGNPNPMLDLTLYNSSGANVTINSGAGQTFTNGASISISPTNSKTIKMWFTSNSTMLVEDLQLTTGVTTLSSAGGTVSLVNDGTGPALATKGLTAGTGISLTDGGTAVTINNTSPATAVVLSNAAVPAVGEGGLVVDGTGPTLSIKKLVAGANVILTDNANDVTIAASGGGGGLTEPLYTSNNRAIIAGNTNNYAGVDPTSYGGILGGFSSTTIANATSRGCFAIGGANNPSVSFSAGTDGSVHIGGDSNNSTFNVVSGSVNIGGSGTLDNANNLIMIGGSNTTMGTTNGSVCIGSSALTTTLRPNVSKTYIKDSPVLIEENTVINIVGVIAAADIAKGLIEIQTGGTYTFDTAVNIRNEVLDSTGAAFVGNIRPYFRSTLYNTSGSIVTINPGAGQTFTNNATIRVKTGSSRTINWWFTSNTTMIVEDLVTYLNDGVGTSLVRTADGPEIEVKGLNAGTGISLSSNTTSVTITNSSPASSVSLTSAGGTTLVSDGTGPTLAIKGLTVLTGLTMTSSASALTIRPTTQYGVYYYRTPNGVAPAGFGIGRNIVPINFTQSQLGALRNTTFVVLQTTGEWMIRGECVVRNTDRVKLYVTDNLGNVLISGINCNQTNEEFCTTVAGKITSTGATIVQLRLYASVAGSFGAVHGDPTAPLTDEIYASLVCTYMGF